jgi:thioredoxin reductase (NADPH)
MTTHDLHDVAFPRLNDDQMAALGRCAGAVLKHYQDGQVLIHAGDRDFKFFVVGSGRIEILDESCDTPRTIAVLERGEFTGDVSHLTGGPSLITAALLYVCSYCPPLDY